MGNFCIHYDLKNKSKLSQCNFFCTIVAQFIPLNWGYFSSGFHVWFWDYNRKKLLPPHTHNVYMAQSCWVGDLFMVWQKFVSFSFISSNVFCIESEQQAGLSLISRSKVLQLDAGGLRNCQFWTSRPTSILAYKIRQWTQQDPTGGSWDGKNGMTLEISIGDTNWSGIIANSRPYFFKLIARKFMAK